MIAAVPGSLIDGRFRIERLLGAGGFGTVYKAEDVGLKRTVAIKILDRTALSDAVSIARFEREAKALSLLQHKNIVGVFSVGADSANRPFIVMPYCEGQTLAGLLAEQTRLPWRQAASIVEQACIGLAAAHAAGIIHRDLKPENIILTESPEGQIAKVLDFGLATFAQSPNVDQQKLTETGMVVGTAYYLSPECCTGHPADERSDIYSLGCILYECLTGASPFEGEDFIRVLYEHVNEPPKRIDRSNIEMTDDLELLVYKAIQKDPRDRFSSMTQFAAALNAALRGQAQQVTLPALPAPSPGTPKLKQSMLLQAGIVFGALVCIGAVAWNALNSSEQWKREQEAAELSASAKQIDEAKLHFRNALRAAKSDSQSLSSALGVVKVSSPFDKPESRNEEVRSLTNKVLTTAKDKEQLLEARVMAAEIAIQDKDYPRVLSLLADDPWHVVGAVRDPFFRGENLRTIKRTCYCGKAEAFLHSTPPRADLAFATLRSNQNRLIYSQWWEDIPGIVTYAHVLEAKGEHKKAHDMLALTLRDLPRRGPDDVLELFRDSLDKPTFDEIMAAKIASGLWRPKQKHAETETEFRQRFSPIKHAYHWKAPHEAGQPGTTGGGR